MTTTETPTTVYVAAKGFVPELVSELEYHANQGVRILDIRGRLILTSGRTIPAAWAQNIWHEPVFLPVTSITNAARTLTSIQRNWHLHSEQHHRRAALIQEKLPHVSAKPFRFGDPLPSSPLGSWTLWEPDCLLASASCSSPFPDGDLIFQENKTDPPSRAYLKLWEAFTIIPTL